MGVLIGHHGSLACRPGPTVSVPITGVRGRVRLVPPAPRSLHWDLGLPAATPSLQMPRVLTLILAPFAGSAASSDLGAQASVLAPQEPSDPGLVLFHPTTATSPQLHSLGPGGQGGHPESGLGQIRGSAGLSAQPCPLRPPTSPSAVCPGDRTFLQGALLPARQCPPVSSCLAKWP